MPTRDTILALVLETIGDLNKELHLEGLSAPDEETRLFGAKSGLDSMALVTLIADLEFKLSDRLGHDLVLADERAMSQTRSPFRRVGTLVDYIMELLNEG
ncbi:MAG: hypothetical protein SFY80_12640 [Verrucomicrobiota bacterium]|nr:hypothetical protein [Verrucomicrobiota bacterium]